MKNATRTEDGLAEIGKNKEVCLSSWAHHTVHRTVRLKCPNLLLAEEGTTHRVEVCEIDLRRFA